MSFLWAGHQPEQRAVDLSSWIRGISSSGVSTSGERVDSESAMSIAAASRAVQFYVDMASTLPVDTFRRAVDGGVPLAVAREPQLVRNPSQVVSPRVWRAQAMSSWLLHGNAYGLILTRSREGHPETVEWLDPNTVNADETSSLRRPDFYINGRLADPNDILHVPGKYVSAGSSLGIAPLERFEETFGLALAARSFGAKWFGDGAHPSAILSTDQAVTPEQAATMKERFVATIRRRREPVVLGAGIRYTPIQTSPNESQFLETQQATISDVARAFDLPIEFLGGASSGSSVTYANREQRAIDLLTFSADPWLVLLENDLYTRHLPGPQFVKVNRDALLRTDLLTRYKAHETAIRTGWKTVDEARELEDMEPLPDGAGNEALWPPYSVTDLESDD